MSLNEFHDPALPQPEWPSAEQPITDAIGGLVGRSVAYAIECLWDFYNRPLPDGGSWAVARLPNGHKEFSCSLSKADRLFETCVDLESHELLHDHERRAIEAVVQIGRALGLNHIKVCASSDRLKSYKVEQTGPNARKEIRRAIGFGTDLRVGRTYYRVKIHNLSRTGTMIEGVPNLKVGDRGSLRVSGDLIDGEIAWTLDRRAGFCFRNPLEEAH